MSTPQLVLFYDAQCPLCVAEMRELTRLDGPGEDGGGGRLKLLALQNEDAMQAYPDLDREAAMRVLHAYDLATHPNQPVLLTGLDVTVRAWQLVGHKPWLAVLRWPVIRVVADACYRWFARNRYVLSARLTGQSRCEVCELSADSNEASCVSSAERSSSQAKSGDVRS